MATDGKRSIFEEANPPSAMEALADAAIRPGALVEQTATGQAESNDAATVFGTQALFADRDFLQAKSVDDSWTSGEQVVSRKLPQDCVANVLVATGQAIARKGTGLSSNGDGTLKIALTDGTEKIVAYSDEIITTTAVTLVRVKGA